jgi:hypothetical protein
MEYNEIIELLVEIGYDLIPENPHSIAESFVDKLVASIAINREEGILLLRNHDIEYCYEGPIDTSSDEPDDMLLD